MLTSTVAYLHVIASNVQRYPIISLYHNTSGFIAARPTARSPPTRPGTQSSRSPCGPVVPIHAVGDPRARWLDPRGNRARSPPLVQSHQERHRARVPGLDRIRPSDAHIAQGPSLG